MRIGTSLWTTAPANVFTIHAAANIGEPQALVAERGDGFDSEQRAERRKRVLKGAKLVFSGDVIDGIVLNISAKGARVLLPMPTPLPEQVALHLNNGVIYNARHCWGLEDEVSFQFEGAPSLIGAFGK